MVCHLILMGLLASLMSACTTNSALGGSSATTTTTVPAPASTAGGSARRGVGINVEPSYRPWRYIDGPAPESWWCQPPDCVPDTPPETRIDTDLALAADLGVNFVRVEFPWRFIEPQRGVYDWSRADLIVQEAGKYHVRLQPIVVYTPQWIGMPTAAPQAADFGAFITALVGRYHGDIQYWELWNEPNLTQYWIGGEKAYVADILVPGYRAAKTADPTAQVVLGGPNWGSVEWLNQIYALGGGDSFDIISWHEYVPLDTVLQSVLDVQGVLRAHNQTNKPMWLTEFGQQDGSATGSAQSSLLEGVLMANNALAQADWYTLRDEDSMTCCPPSVAVAGHYGLVQSDGVTRKAGFPFLQRLIRSGLPLVSSSQ